MLNYPSKLQFCSAKASLYGGLFKETVPPLFNQNPPLQECGIKLDISCQRITDKQLADMRKSAEASNVFGLQRAMANGEIVNFSESRAALHTLLRNSFSQLAQTKDVKQILQQMERFAEGIRKKEIVSSKGLSFTDVINIGIGGSYAGPKFVCEACQTTSKNSLRIHWVSNVDGWVLHELLPHLNPQTTLVIVSSKSFGTAETLLNAEYIKNWYLKSGINTLANHFVLCTTNPEAPKIIGISEPHVFKFWEWVGGRFSVWSSVGLPVLLAIGASGFKELLTGAHDMDKHALEAKAEVNIPLTLAILSIWNSTALKTTSYCFLPYEHRLRSMVNWLQQLEMESLGKSRLIDGTLTKYPTCTPVWGGLGNEAQHAFYQCLRQGTNRTAIDIVTANNSSDNIPNLHGFLLANAKAQANALVSQDSDSKAINFLSVINLEDLSPYRIGALMALYEHKTTMLGFLLGINPFDQPGVELGKEMAQKIWKDENK